MIYDVQIRNPTRKYKHHSIQRKGHCGKWFGSSSKKLNIESPHNPAIPLQGIHPKEVNTGTRVPSSTIIYRRKVKTAHVSSNGWADKQNAVYLRNGLLLHHKKDWSTDTCYDVMNHKYTMLSERSQRQRVTCDMIPFMWNNAEWGLLGVRGWEEWGETAW